MLSHGSVFKGLIVFHQSSHSFSLHNGVAIIHYFVRFTIKQRTQFLFCNLYAIDPRSYIYVLWLIRYYIYFFLIIIVNAWGLCYVCNYRHFKQSGLGGIPYIYTKITGEIPALSGAQGLVTIHVNILSMHKHICYQCINIYVYALIVYLRG